MNLHQIKPAEDLTLLYLQHFFSYYTFVRVNPDLITYNRGRSTVRGDSLKIYDHKAQEWDRRRCT